VSLRWSLASQQLWAVVISTAPSTGSPSRFAASLAATLAGCLLFCGLAGIFQQPVHHWHPLQCNQRSVFMRI
jgi:hypothetical protein